VLLLLLLLFSLLLLFWLFYCCFILSLTGSASIVAYCKHFDVPETSKWPLSRSKNLPSGTKPLTRLSNGHIKKRNPLLAAFHIQPKLLVLCGQILQKAEFLKELKPSEAHLVALPHVHVQTVAIIGWPISMISAPECKRLSCGHKLTVTLRILTSLTVRSPTILPPTMFLPRGWIVKACVAQVTPTVGR
jgi:hypothetical protein